MTEAEDGNVLCVLDGWHGSWKSWMERSSPVIYGFLMQSLYEVLRMRGMFTLGEFVIMLDVILALLAFVAAAPIFIGRSGATALACIGISNPISST